MLKSVCALFSLLFVASLASAEVFKCVGKNGEALYQNFPCQFESIERDASGCSEPKGWLSQISHGCRGPKSPAAPAEPRIGMTSDEVRAIWGEPTDTVQEEPGDRPPCRGLVVWRLSICAL